jgi:hypothetical protein
VVYVLVGAYPEGLFDADYDGNMPYDKYDARCCLYVWDVWDVWDVHVGGVCGSAAPLCRGGAYLTGITVPARPVDVWFVSAFLTVYYYTTLTHIG